MKLEDFIGKWINKAGNILEIKSKSKRSLSVNFISGKTNQPVTREYYENKLSINLTASLDFYETGIEVELWKRGMGFHMCLHRDQVFFNSGDYEFYLAPGLSEYEGGTLLQNYGNLFFPLDYYKKTEL
ncbi:MAG: hypothetical protein Q8R57_09545 [Bacteroidota bacterium]|nr:hypothetical protein [Bacteroidota bacterium]